jgi:hypothetical protein
VCLLLQYLLQSCLRGGRGLVEDCSEGLPPPGIEPRISCSVGRLLVLSFLCCLQVRKPADRKRSDS